MLVDGKAFAAELSAGLRVQVAEMPDAPRLAVLTCTPNFETQKFLALKRKRADEIGVQVTVIELPETTATADVVATIAEVATESDGIVLQLPFPPKFDTEQMIAAIPETHDVDALSLRDKDVLPPVVGALRHILEAHEVPLVDRQVVIVGDGRLVGAPAAMWFRAAGAQVRVVTKTMQPIDRYTSTADIVVLGVGIPHLLTPDMVQNGVIILDAGTSEADGVLTGDADPACSQKAALMTPVPGGIGPLTIAMLLQNLVMLTRRRRAMKKISPGGSVAR